MPITAIPPDRALIVWEPTGAPPSGYIKANGALLSRAVYAWLFGRIGVVWGAGDGSTTFAIPDLRAEFLRGLDDGRGVDAGRVLASAQADQIQGHHHQFFATNNGTTGGAGGNPGGSATNTGVDNVKDLTTDGINGAPRSGTETRPRNVAGLYCIAYAP